MSDNVKPRIDHKDDKQAAAIQQEMEELQRDFAYVAATEHGQNVLRAIMIACHATKSCAVEIQNGSFDPVRLAYNAGKQDVWRIARNYIPFEYLTKVEDIRLKPEPPRTTVSDL